jgi:hypothetical protein
VSAGHRRALLGGCVAHGFFLRHLPKRVLPLLLWQHSRGLLQSAPDGRSTQRFDVYTDLRASPLSRCAPELSCASRAHMWRLYAVMRNASAAAPTNSGDARAPITTQPSGATTGQ